MEGWVNDIDRSTPIIAGFQAAANDAALRLRGRVRDVRRGKRVKARRRVQGELQTSLDHGCCGVGDTTDVETGCAKCAGAICGTITCEVDLGIFAA
jgi:hypothetical protein